jgi:hypothetical protein
MAKKILDMDKDSIQNRLVEEFQNRINSIEKWEDKNPITILILEDRIFISIKNVSELIENEEAYKNLNSEIQTANRIAMKTEYEIKQEQMINYKANVLKFLKIYEVPTYNKELNITNPNFKKDERISETNTEKIKLYIKEEETNGIINLNTLSTQSFLYRLLGLTDRKDITLEELVYQAKVFESKGYEINLDNFLKITLILQRAKLRIPVVCIGETGCGKTFMIKFISSVLMNVQEFHHETLHTGYTEVELRDFVIEIVNKAREAREKKMKIEQEVSRLRIKKYQDRDKKINFKKEHQEKLKELEVQLQESDEFWIFFDEFNTSVLQTYICEMMTERVSSLLPYHHNVTLINSN